MLITFLQEVLFVISRIIACSLATKLLRLRIYEYLQEYFQCKISQKKKNFQAWPEKVLLYYNESIVTKKGLNDPEVVLSWAAVNAH